MYAVPPKIKDKTAAKWAKALAPVLAEGEEVWAFAKVARFKPQTEALAVTNQRLLGFKSFTTVESKIVVFSAPVSEIVNVEYAEKYGATRLVVATATGEINFGDIRKDELDFVQHYVRYLVDSSRGTNGIEEKTALRTGIATATREHLQRRTVQESPLVLGLPLGDSWAKEIENCSAPGELPSLIINSGSAGLLAAFEDRLVIVKAQAMYGREFESQAVSLTYSNISEIEYRRGLSDGVLEVRARDATGAALDRVSGWDGSDPNTLRLSWSLHETARPYLDELRNKVAAMPQKQPVSLWKPPLAPRIVESSVVEVPAAGGLAVEIEKLANLFSQGLIDADEFREAKRAVIAKHS